MYKHRNYIPLDEETVGIKIKQVMKFKSSGGIATWVCLCNHTLFAQKHEFSEGTSHANICGKGVLGRMHSRCKDSEIGYMLGESKES